MIAAPHRLIMRPIQLRRRSGRGRSADSSISCNELFKKICGSPATASTERGTIGGPAAIMVAFITV
jgi:hypothetical protein